MDSKCREAFEAVWRPVLNGYPSEQVEYIFRCDDKGGYVGEFPGCQWEDWQAAWNAALAAALDVVTCDEAKTLRGISELRAKTDG
jgi:hypothetical protein